MILWSKMCIGSFSFFVKVESEQYFFALRWQVFSVDLVDKDGGEIRASFFNEAVGKFHSILEEGKVFTFRSGQVRVFCSRCYVNEES